MAENCASYSIKGQIAVVTIDHPPMNILDMETKEAIGAAFEDLKEGHEDIRATILCSSLKKAFAAGSDIKRFGQLTPVTAKEHINRTHNIYDIIENIPWPVIAALHGFCLGAGLELALACDIRYAAENTRLGFPEVNLSVFPGGGGIQRAFFHLPLGKLRELVYTGDLIDAKEALTWGLVEKVVPNEKLMDAAMALATKIANKGPLGVSAAKQTINEARDRSIEDGLALESSLWADLTATEDMKEGVRAFFEKRTPIYRRR